MPASSQCFVTSATCEQNVWPRLRGGGGEGNNSLNEAREGGGSHV